MARQPASPFVVPDPGWSGRLPLRRYGTRAQIARCASQVSVQTEQFKKEKRRSRISVSDDHLTSSHFLPVVQMKRKTHSRKGKVGVIFRGPHHKVKVVNIIFFIFVRKRVASQMDAL